MRSICFESIWDIGVEIGYEQHRDYDSGENSEAEEDDLDYREGGRQVVEYPCFFRDERDS